MKKFKLDTAAICEKSDDCTKAGKGNLTCQHKKIHKRTLLCRPDRCSVGGRVRCVPPNDGQIVMEKMESMRGEGGK